MVEREGFCMENRPKCQLSIAIKKSRERESQRSKGEVEEGGAQQAEQWEILDCCLIQKDETSIPFVIFLWTFYEGDVKRHLIR